MTIGGIDYTGEIPSNNTVGTSVLLKGPDGLNAGSLVLSIPTSQGMLDLFGVGDVADIMPAPNNVVNMMALSTGPSYPQGLPVGTNPSASPAVPPANLGVGTVGFNLTKGTEGGLITLDELTSINIGADGTVSVSHPDKGVMSVGKLSLANFANPRGLLQSGTNYYTATVNSGPPVLCDPGTNGSGAIKASTLEMSNVDLAQEFADMIVTQRGFQANTRIISVSDQMLEELVNLKR